MSIEHFDVVIVGAGLSGIGAACHLRKAWAEQPGGGSKTLALLEARAQLGGTWDLFRYPGVRSDSDMYTLGYQFRPWDQPKAIADGPAILKYLQDTAREHDVERHIRYQQTVTDAAWSSADACWTLAVQCAANTGAHADEEADALSSTADSAASSAATHTAPNTTTRTVRCNFLLMCAGYYTYAAGYKPPFEGAGDFQGPIVHPQQWDASLDWAGKRVVVIGSGATAVTLVPALAERAAHVTMLQRSPTYVVARASVDRLATGLQHWLPLRLAHGITRFLKVAESLAVFALSRRYPDLVKKKLLAEAQAALGDSCDVSTHFTPRYKPWDQRICLVPDGDLFAAIKSGRASVVTEHISHFTARGVALKSGAELPADVIVTATGLNLQLFGGLRVHLDGQQCDLSQHLTYKGVMVSSLPNFAATFGYTNASWTLKADLISGYVVRLLAHMAQHGFASCTPVPASNGSPAQRWVDFSSGYFARGEHLFPKQGGAAPWLQHQNYLKDLWTLRWQGVAGPGLVFAKRPVS
jgi:monooxygenase